MTKEEIMKMDDRELYRLVCEWMDDGLNSVPLPRTFAEKLACCYQAEEKLLEAGDKDKLWARNLWKITFGENVNWDEVDGPLVSWWDIAIIAHKNPRDRARSILLTISDDWRG